MPKKILISTRSFGVHNPGPLDRLQEAGIDVTLNPFRRKLTEAEITGLLEDQQGLIAGTEPLTSAVFDANPILRVVSRCGVGTDSVDLAAARRRGVQVLTTDRSHVESVAELALGGLLAVLRGIPLADREIRDGRWHKPNGSLLRGKTVGLVGLGRVGRRFAELLQPFGVRLLATDPNPSAEFAQAQDITYIPLEELLPQSDIVSLHLPMNDETRQLLDRARLANAKRGAILLNTARGGVVDENALADLLQAGHFRGAFLDTFEQEPYEGPLAQLDNVVLSPHVGAAAAEARIAMESEAVENLLGALQ